MMKWNVLFLPLLFSLPGLVFAGNEGGGGGNVPPDTRMTIEDFRGFFDYLHDGEPDYPREFKVLKSSMVWFFTGLEVNHQALPESVRKKLWPGAGENIYDAIKKAAVVENTESACLDPISREEMDGSADLKHGRVCISTYRLKDKLSVSTAYPSFLRLAAHEFSHLMGLNEDEAAKIQFVHGLYGVDSPEWFFRLARDLSGAVSLINQAVQKLTVMDTADFPLSPKERCRELLFINDSRIKLISLLNEMSHSSALLMSASNYWTIHRDLFNNVATPDFAELCAEQGDDAIRKAIREYATSLENVYGKVMIIGY